MLVFLNVPVADLRAEAHTLLPNDYTHQEGRLSQLSFGDRLFLHRQEEEWLFISVLEQLRVQGKQWQPYQGWVHQSEVTPYLRNQAPLSFTKIINPKELLKEANHFMDLPFLWGGCSPKVTDKIASVDCSGLMYQLFKRQGRLIPRDAHDQYLSSKPIDKPEVGDLLFLRPLHKQEKRMTHVLMLYDQEHYLEAPESGKKVRLLRWGKEIWQKNGLFHIYDREKIYLGYFRRILFS